MVLVLKFICDVGIFLRCKDNLFLPEYSYMNLFNIRVYSWDTNRGAYIFNIVALCSMLCFAAYDWFSSVQILTGQPNLYWSVPCNTTLGMQIAWERCGGFRSKSQERWVLKIGSLLCKSWRNVWAYYARGLNVLTLSLGKFCFQAQSACRPSRRDSFEKVGI